VSQENVEIVRRLYGAWGNGELPGPAELLDPEIEYVNPDGAIEPGTRRGLSAFSAAIDKLFDGWSTWEMEPESFIAVGDKVAVVIRYRGTGRTSGIEAAGRESALLTVRDRAIVRYEWFHGPDDAVKAVGLEDG
jgi:ketosteroid isomerase-like protein